MKSLWTCAVVALIASATSAWAAAGADTVYQRTQSDGAVSLTNVPDGAGYQVLVTGTRADSASSGTENSANASSPTGNGRPAPSDATTALEEQQQSVAPRLAETPASMEVRTGKLLDADTAVSMASLQTQQAQDEITSAGGMQARLQSLYKASASAFQSRQASQSGHR